MADLYPFGGVYWDASNSYWLALIGRVEYTDDDLRKLRDCEQSDEQRAELDKAIAAIPGRAPTQTEREAGRRAMKYEAEC